MFEFLCRCLYICTCGPALAWYNAIQTQNEWLTFSCWIRVVIVLFPILSCTICVFATVMDHLPDKKCTLSECSHVEVIAASLLLGALGSLFWLLLFALLPVIVTVLGIISLRFTTIAAVRLFYEHSWRDDDEQKST